MLDLKQYLATSEWSISYYNVMYVHANYIYVGFAEGRG